MARGVDGRSIYIDDVDRNRFLNSLQRIISESNASLLAYCLMGNHFHLVVETAKRNLVAGIKWLLGTYTLRFNRRDKVCGHLFSGALGPDRRPGGEQQCQR